VDDLLATLGVLVMIEQQAVFWSRGVYQLQTLGVFYAVILSGQTMIWYVRIHVHVALTSLFTRYICSSG
jgi:hypothetical protein